jgi:hypothetical protein
MRGIRNKNVNDTRQSNCGEFYSRIVPMAFLSSSLVEGVELEHGNDTVLACRNIKVVTIQNENLL